MSYDDVIKWKHFPRYWPFVRGIRRSPVKSPNKGQWRSFDVFIDLRLNKRLSKQSWGWWFETLSRPLWRHSNEWTVHYWLRYWILVLSTCHANTWSKTDLALIELLRTNFSEIWIKIQNFDFLRQFNSKSRHLRHILHRKLLKWYHPVQPLTKISSKCFSFSETSLCLRCIKWNKRNRGATHKDPVTSIYWKCILKLFNSVWCFTGMLLAWCLR